MTVPGGSKPEGAPAAGGGRRAAWAIAFIGGLTVLLFAAFASAVRRPEQGPEVGRPAPDFTLLTFDGGTVALDELRGQVVVLNFWASWCVPCADEADELEALWRRFKDRGVMFIGVDYVDTEGPARRYLATYGVTYPNGPDLGGRISDHYKVTGVPETFVVDPDGRLVSLAAPGMEPVDRLKAPLTAAAAFTPSDLAALIERLIRPATGSDRHSRGSRQRVVR